MATSEELAWAAGFIDGEGCIHISRAKSKKYVGHQYQLVLRVTQRTREPLDRLSEIFGGFIGGYCATSYAKNKQWVWGASNGNAGIILSAILPYLVVKRSQAELALEFQSIRHAGPAVNKHTGRFVAIDKTRYEEFYWQMRDLKKVS